nr:immunoglobulin light chain junction region [Macaca mulatta]MOV99993.1 immunoglobulin light chain junction region [Macaca mulatta]
DYYCHVLDTSSDHLF